MKVLIVDDEPIDIALLRRALSSGDIDPEGIFSFNNVADALHAISTNKFDVILLDYRMPEVNGVEVILEIRALPENGDIAIIVVSAVEDDKLVLQCLDAGAQDFLAKKNVSHIKLYQAIMQARKRFELEQKLLQSYQAAKSLSERDTLTGLYNRYYLDEMLKLTMINTHRSGASMAMLAIDIDGFKHINDSFGHLVGDQLLLRIVDRLKSCLRENDLLARVGGDEFSAIINEFTSINEVSQVAQSILGTFKQPFNVEGREISCTASLGVAMYPGDASDSLQLMKFANIAMYRSKSQGANKLTFYEAHYQSEFNKHFLIQGKISEVLLHSSFRTVYQPIYDTQTKALVGFETLVRWPESSETFYPDEFIPIAEDSRQIVEIGAFVMRRALANLAIFHTKISDKLYITINVSPIQLQIEDFADQLLEECKASQIQQNQVVVEITETALLDRGDHVKDNLEKLDKIGFKLALDDFGMGYSSISHLIDFPISIVKLDRSLQKNQSNNDKTMKVLEAVTSMLQKLRLRIVAEGIETEEQLNFCKNLNIQNSQGYFLSMPLPFEEILASCSKSSKL